MAKWWVAAFLVALGSGLAGPAVADAATRPARIVSLDLCSDQFVLALADRDQIAAVSKVAGDAYLSPMAGRAAGVGRHRGSAEEVLALRADLAIGGGFARRATLDLLAKVGVKVLRVPAMPRLADLPPQLERVAAALGHPARGSALADDIRTRLATRKVAAGQTATVGVYRPGGTMPGDGTLVADMVSATGLRLDAMGKGGRVTVPLELLVLRTPDVLIINSRRDDRFGMSQAMLDHPALEGQGRRMALAEFPLRYWLCNSPASSEGLGILEAELIRSLAGGRP